MADDENTNNEDPIARIAESLSGLGTQLGESVSTAVADAMAKQGEETRNLIETLRPAVPNPDDEKPGDAIGEVIPGMVELRADPSNRMVDPYTAGWSDRSLSPADNDAAVRSNFEIVSMLGQGVRTMKRQPIDINFGDDFKAAARFYMFEHPDMPAPQIYSGGEDGDYSARNVRAMDPQRAMDSQETGFGLELIGVQYANELWRAARRLDSIVGSIRDIPMTDPTTRIPIDGALPEMLLVGESTSSSASAYDTSKTASQRRTLTAKKFTIQQIWSAEIQEDSLIAWVPFLREQLELSTAAHLGSAYLNGDTTNSGSGNINLDDADPADTKHYLAWDGIRHYWLVTTTGQGKNMAAALTLSEINVMRGKMNGTDDDLDSAVGNINWGANPRDLMLVTDWDSHLSLLDTDKVVTVDKYGPSATIISGELGSLYGIPIVSPGYAVKTEADGKQSTTEASNTKGQITLFAPRGWIAGTRRESMLFIDRIQGTDQFLLEWYSRKAFQRHGAFVSAGIYNITV